VRVAGELPEAVEGPEEEPEDDLTEVVAGRLRRRLHLLEPDAIDPLGDKHAFATQLGDDIRDDDERMSTPTTREPALSLSLVLIVELLAYPLADL